MSNEKGECIWEIELNTWGKTQKVKAQHEDQILEQTHIRFQGQYYDEETGLHYNRYRYYEPYSGRYLSKDPIGIIGDLNDKKYVNNPNQWVDIYGLAPWANKAPTKTRCKYIECNFPSPDYLLCSGGVLGTSGSLAINLNNGDYYTGLGAGTSYAYDVIKELTSLTPKVKTGAGVSCLFYTIQKLPKSADRALVTHSVLEGVGINVSAGLGIISFGVDKPIQLERDANNKLKLAKEQYYAVGVGAGIGGGVDISMGGLLRQGNVKDVIYPKNKSNNVIQEDYKGPHNLPNIDGVLQQISNISW